MLIKNIDDQTIALAGLYQCCQAVSDIAWNGEYNEGNFLPLINSILEMNSANLTDIYLDINEMKPGLEYLRKQMIGDIFTRSSETRRYIVSLRLLANNLMKNSEIIILMQKLLKELKDDGDNLDTDQKTNRLSEIYQQTLSKFEPRIIVNGDNTHLTNPLQASRIRTALFAGVRATLLWQQLGGTKWKLVVFKSSFSKSIDKYLEIAKN